MYYALYICSTRCIDSQWIWVESDINLECCGFQEESWGKLLKAMQHIQKRAFPSMQPCKFASLQVCKHAMHVCSTRMAQCKYAVQCRKLHFLGSRGKLGGQYKRVEKVKCLSTTAQCSKDRENALQQEITHFWSTLN